MNLIYDIRDYGAVSKPDVLNTIAIQNAIDDCAANGGGKVVVAGGEYETGAVRLLDHVILYIEGGSKLVGSTYIEDYLYDNMRDEVGIALVYAIHVNDISIEGNGGLEGRGEAGGYWPNKSDIRHRRPKLIYMENCEHVTVKDVMLTNPAAWTTCFYHCKNVICSGVSIWSLKSANGDGLDFIGGENVAITGCIIEAGDDAISLKTMEKEDTCRNFAITNCIMTTRWAGIRLGAESDGDMREIIMSNCVFDCCGDGFKIQNCGDSIYENMQFSQIVMRNVARPFFVTLNTCTFSKKEVAVHRLVQCVIFNSEI